MKAKDRATGKEQQVRITASSMLDKSAVDQMVRDAQEHAEEDRQRREEVETRNQAEALTFQAERAIKDLGDKVSSEDKVEVENQISLAARVAQGLRHGAVKAGMSSLAEVLQRVSTAAYQASAAGGGVEPTARPARTGPGPARPGTGWRRRCRGPTEARDGRGRVQGGLGLRSVPIHRDGPRETAGHFDSWRCRGR